MPQKGYSFLSDTGKSHDGIPIMVYAGPPDASRDTRSSYSTFQISLSDQPIQLLTLFYSCRVFVFVCYSPSPNHPLIKFWTHKDGWRVSPRRLAFLCPVSKPSNNDSQRLMSSWVLIPATSQAVSLPVLQSAPSGSQGVQSSSQSSAHMQQCPFCKSRMDLAHKLNTTQLYTVRLSQQQP